jgi:hypothetical protein
MKEKRNRNQPTPPTTDALARMVKQGFDQVEKRLDTLEQGQERIELRLLNVAYNIDVQELRKRVALPADPKPG